MDTKDIEEVGKDTPFGPAAEKAIISLAFDHPDFFSTIGNYLSAFKSRCNANKAFSAASQKVINSSSLN